MDSTPLVIIVNRYEHMLYSFNFMNFSTLAKVKKNISKDLHIGSNDLILYEFDKTYIDSVKNKYPLRNLLGCKVDPMMKLILMVRGNFTENPEKEYAFKLKCSDFMGELAIKVLGSTVVLYIEVIQRTGFIQSAIEAKTKIPVRNQVLAITSTTELFKYEYISTNDILTLIVIGDRLSEADDWLTENNISPITTFKLTFLSNVDYWSSAQQNGPLKNN